MPPAGEEDDEEEGPPVVVATDEDGGCVCVFDIIFLFIAFLPEFSIQCATKSAFFTFARLRLVRGSGSVSSKGLLRTVGHVVQHCLSPLPLNCSQ